MSLFLLNFTRIKGLIKKETYQIIRDPSSILIAFILPCLLIFISGYALSLDVQKLKVGLVLEESSPNITLLAESFLDSPYFEVTVSHNRRESEDLLVAGKVRGMIVVPFYFDRQVSLTGEPVALQVIADGSETNTASLLQNYVRGVRQTWLQQKRIQEGAEVPPAIQLSQRMWYNPAGMSSYFLVPGSISIIMTLIGTLLTALVIAREWERGTMEAVMATPTTITEIMLGKIVPYFVLGLGSMVVCVLLALFVFHIPLRGSLWLLFLVSALFLTTSLSLGLLISTLARNQFEASQTALYTAYLPSFLLSGFIFEINSMPLPIQGITYFLPARYFVNNLQTLFLAGNIYPLIFKNCIGIVVIGGFFILLVRKRLRKRLD